MKRFENKVAIVTGGSRDLGRAVSVQLAAEGAKVCVNYFGSEAAAKETAELIAQVGGECILVKGDMTKVADVKNLVAETQKAFGEKIDVLVNVVGGMVGRKKIAEQEDDWYDIVMDVNMRSVWLATRAVVPFMTAGASLYATSKAAVSTFTRSMAKELGPDGIRVNAVCPGTIATSFHDIFNTPENRERMKGNYPLRREGQADEVADLVCYLASDEASYITGANIDINGGVFFS